MKSADKSLWVGKRLTENGRGIYVYDVMTEGEKIGFIYLYDTYQDSMQQFSRKGLRDFFKTVKGLKSRESAIQQYASWLMYYGEEFAQMHQLNVTQEEIREHAMNLTKQYPNSDSNLTTYDLYINQRSTRCVYCHEAINNQSNDECEKCHWIKCNHCGSCGCTIRTRNF